MKIIFKNSPNQSERVHGDDAVRLVICHTPEGSYAGASATIMNPAAQVSYHLLIRKDGSEATQFVPWGRKAWHAKALNSLSDGISVEGFARQFDLSQPGVKQMARQVAIRLHARDLKPQWTTDVAKGGFCRHGDLQSDRTDPTPDLGEWRLFVGMVRDAYDVLAKEPEKPWPIPIPEWFWVWAAWKLGDTQGSRPNVRRRIPLWAWRRLRALKQGRV